MHPSLFKRAKKLYAMDAAVSASDRLPDNILFFAMLFNTAGKRNLFLVVRKKEIQMGLLIN